MAGKFGSLIYPCQCWRCEKWVWVVIPQQGGIFLADSLGKPWPRHDCLEQLQIAPEEVRNYLAAPARRIEQLWRDAPQSMKESGTAHILLDSIRHGRRVRLGSQVYVQTSVASVRGEEVSFYAPLGFSRNLAGVSLAQVFLKTYQRGQGEIAFLDKLTPFFESEREIIDMAPKEDVIGLPMEVIKSR